MEGTNKKKRWTVILIALTVAVVYTVAMVACVLLIKNDSGILTGNMSSSDMSYSSSEDLGSIDDVTSSDPGVSSELQSSESTDSDLSSSDVSDESSDVSSEEQSESTSSEETSSENTSTDNTSSGNTSSENSSSGNTSSGGASSDKPTSSGGSSSGEEQKPPKSSFTSAIWYSCYDYNFKGKNYTAFKAEVDKMFDAAVDLGSDAVICHVRAFADAYYPSELFPYSKELTGTQGNDPGYDPLEYMVQAAHARGLEFHAWLNPYRISTTTSNVNTLAATHPARVWLNDDDPGNDRNVVAYNNGLYFNPATAQSRKLIIDGVREILDNYDVEGIHIDDYFYPNPDESFDKTEYDAFVSAGGLLSLGDWRRANVDALVSGIYGAVQQYSGVVFGVSPAYYISNDKTDDNYNKKYADIAKWMNSDGFIDYIAPQIYFGYEHPSADYTKILNRWLSVPRKSSVKMYIGLAAYKIGTVDADTAEWQTATDILARQTADAKAAGCNGVFIFSYQDVVSGNTLNTQQMKNLKEALSKAKLE